MNRSRGEIEPATKNRPDWIDLMVMGYLVFGTWIFPLPLDDLAAFAVLLRGRMPTLRRMLKFRPILAVVGLGGAFVYGATFGSVFTFFTGGDELLLSTIIWNLLQVGLPEEEAQE